MRSYHTEYWYFHYVNFHCHSALTCRMTFYCSLCISQWVIAQCLCFQETNPAELLRLYLNFDLLEEATYLALEYIDAVLGPQKKDFAMKVTHCKIGRLSLATANMSARAHTHTHTHTRPQTTLHASSPSVWLPYSALDHLQIALQGAQRETSLAEVL